MKQCLRNLLLFVLFMLAMPAYAQDSSEVAKSKLARPVLSSFMIDFGKASVLDTYLSPLRYRGLNARLEYERMQAMKFNPEKWIMQYEAGIDYSPAKNPAGSRLFHTLMADFKWGMMNRWKNLPFRGLQLYAGSSTQFRGGAIYAPSNSNNVVSVKMGWNVAFSGMVVYNMCIGKMPLTFRYQVTLPLVGVTYSLDYGENYFEMYEGNHSGLVHFAWIGNCFGITNFVTADMHLGCTTLRLGYRNVVETSWLNNLNTQMFRNSFVLGVGGEWLTLRPSSKVSEKTRLISAMY